MSGSAPETFDAASMPLDGVRLIEASAGTGKTFSLAGLYLRLIVEQQLDVRQILVMTFTRAATQELRERLRARLALAARVAAEPGGSDRADAAAGFAESVITAAGGERAATAARLQDAATRIDQATITTIHGFAQRAAAENAFDSGLPFDRGEPADERTIQQEATADYWRSRVFGTGDREARAFLGLWRSPDMLHGELREILHKPHVRLVGLDDDQLSRDHEQARARWRHERADFIELLEQARATPNALYAGSKLKSELEAHGAEAIAQRIDDGLVGTADGCPALPPVVADLGDDAGVSRHAQQRGGHREWFRPQDLAAMPLLARLAVDGRLQALNRAAETVGKRTAARKHERRLFSFNDLIASLHEAVHDEAGGPRLAAALRRTWPWALVDESQDTDPLQYAILRRIYADQRQGGSGLILVGDPKQAIYGFRGGDVFTYLAAATDADGRYGMGRNFRSTPGVINGLNALFGAGGDRAFVLDGIDFAQVEADRRAGDRRLLHDETELSGVTAWAIPDDTGTAKNAVESRIERATVGRIVELLDGARLAADADERHPLRSGDIAVLVNSNAQAASMQEALRAANVPAVCIHQDSVFARAAATDLLRLLRAVAAPLDAGRLRLALTTPLFGYRLGDLVALDADEASWTLQTERFQQLHALWTRIGVQAMLEPVLQDAAARIAALTDGERHLTDYLHVADRLQQAEHEAFGLDGLVQWLADAVEQAGEGEVADADRLRLADDSELVQVTTVHKAKGLQFPVVFVPYTPWLGTAGEPHKPPLEFHDAQGRAVIDPGSRQWADHVAAALRERRAEQMRLLYVALTRAEQACFFVHGPANGAADGPLAWLLHQQDGVRLDEWSGNRTCPKWMSAERCFARLAEVASTSAGGLGVEPLPEATGVGSLARSGRDTEIRPARTDLPGMRPPWGVFSFSGLAGRMTAAAEPSAGEDDPAGLPPETAGEGGIALSPRGPAFGQAFHELLGEIPFADWPDPGTEPGDERHARIATVLRRHGVAITSGAEGSVGTTASMLSRTLHTPLPGIGRLARIEPARRSAEMEFFIRLGGARAEEILDRIAAAGYTGARGRTAAPVLRGLMHGYIDLVVEQEETWWLLDYKTNALGPKPADYRPQRLAEAMAGHHYDLQYLIYVVALHRHLRQRVAGYDPARHLGGVLYLFVRGLDGDSDHGVFHDRPDPELVVELDALLDRTQGQA